MDTPAALVLRACATCETVVRDDDAWRIVWQRDSIPFPSGGGYFIQSPWKYFCSEEHLADWLAKMQARWNGFRPV